MNYKISVIIPVYNQKDCLKPCIGSLKKQTFRFSEMEILLIDDGSTDGSGKIARGYEAKYGNVRYIYQENRGVSAARNNGIRNASGKYMFFLDADDCLSKDCIEKVSDFFDSVYDETDLVTYRIETVYNGKRLGPHFRYKELTESGVYDLCEWAYIGQTTMNVAVRNCFEDNILFDESQTFLEDQKYCCDVLRRTLKMGYCNEGEYLYYRNENSSSGRMAGSCFVFEQSMKFFEELFALYDNVPLAFQGLYVYDIYWKHICNMLYPWHYGKDNYNAAILRIRLLLGRCSPDVILNHPDMDFFEKCYFLRLADSDVLVPYINSFLYELKYQNKPVLRETMMEIDVTRIKFDKGKLELSGFAKSAFFQFYDGEFSICAVENDGYLTKKLTLADSSYNYYLSHEPTQRFKAFRYTANLSDVRNVRFEAGFRGHWFGTYFRFMPLIPLSYNNQRYTASYQGYEISLNDSNKLCFYKLPEAPERRVWLYYDCAGVELDNGGLQFCHDVEKEDGIERYYILTDPRQRKHISRRDRIVRFASTEHKRLLEKCAKVLTAYIEESNIFPYDADGIEKHADKFWFETVYLQHGVLHIKMPWKFSPERIIADKIVVSTVEEKELYIINGFEECNLLETGMARFEYLDRNKPKKKKILFAPSWRSYLAGSYKKHHWEVHENKLLCSAYFKGILSFINDEKLAALLCGYGWELDVKLHPIFEAYKDCVETSCPNIHTLSGHVTEEEYGLFITDFSSFAYDFLYLGIDIIHYIPDKDEFLCGMNDYRELNYPEEFWQRAAYTPNEAVDKIKLFISLNKSSFKTSSIPDAANTAANEACDGALCPNFTDGCTFLPFKHPTQELYERLMELKPTL